MADIATNQIGGKPTRSFPDYIFNGQATPQNTSVTSDEVLLGRTQNALEVVVEVDEAITVTSADFTVEYLYGASFAESIVLYTITAGVGGETLPVGELTRFVPPSGLVDSPAKIKVTTDDAAADGSFTVFAALISR